MFLEVCVCPRGGLLPGDAWSGEGSAPGGVGVMSGPGRGCGDPPDGYCCGRYTSYWNVFLLLSSNSTAGYVPVRK